MSEAERPAGRELAVLWLIALAIAVPLGVLAVRYVRNLDVPPSQAFYEFNAPRVDEFAARVDDGAYGVVLFGDSRLRNGLPLQDDLGELLSDASGQDVAVLRIVNDWAIYDDFEPFVPAIVQAEPDLVIVQEELRERHRGLDASELLQREYLWWKLFGSGAWSPGDRSQTYLQRSADCAADEGVEERRVRIGRWVSFDADGSAPAKVAAFAAQATAQDIEVRYLTIPVTTAAAAGLPGVEKTEGQASLGPDITIDDTHFCDVVHMGPSGRDIYTDWFVDTLADDLVSRRTDR